MRLADLSMPLKRLPVICSSRAWSKPPVQLVILIEIGTFIPAPAISKRRLHPGRRMKQNAKRRFGRSAKALRNQKAARIRAAKQALREKCSMLYFPEAFPGRKLWSSQYKLPGGRMVENRKIYTVFIPETTSVKKQHKLRFFL